MAEKPAIDNLAKRGRTGRLITVPKTCTREVKLPTCRFWVMMCGRYLKGAECLKLPVLGLPWKKMILHFVATCLTIEDENIKNHSAGHISNTEAYELIEFLNKKLGNEIIRFYPGVSYRHLLVIKGGKKHMNCTPPHDVPGMPFRPCLIKAQKQEADAYHQTTQLLDP